MDCCCCFDSPPLALPARTLFDGLAPHTDPLCPFGTLFFVSLQRLSFFFFFFLGEGGWDAAERKRSCEVVALQRDFCRSPANRRDLVLCRGIAPMGPSLGGLPSNTTDCGSPELHNALTRVTSTASCTPPKHGRSWARTSSQIVTTCQMPSSWARSYSTGWEAVCGGCDSHAG